MRLHRPDEPILILGLLLVLGFLASLASQLNLDYFDTFQILQNGQYLLGSTESEYVTTRSVLSSVLTLPALFFTGNPFDALRWFHWQALFSYCLFVLSAFFWIRKSTTRKWALLGALVFSLNPLALQYSIFGKEDIIAAAAVNFSLLLYLRWHTKPTFFRSVCVGLGILASVGLRYNLIPVLYLCFPIHCLLTKRKSLPSSAWIMFALPIVGFLLLQILISPQVSSVADLVSSLFRQYQDNKLVYHPPSWVPVLLFASIPVLLWVPFGFSFKKANALPLLFLTVFLSVHAFMIPGKEARYLLPVFPCLYGMAFGELARWRLWPILKYFPALTALVIATAGLPALRQLQDPVYASSFPGKLIEQIRSRDPKRIIWMGPFYPVVPKQPIFHIKDDYTRIYHWFSHVVGYYLERRVWAIVTPISPRITDSGAVPSTGLGLLRTGDVIIYNPAPRSYVTALLKLPLPPLTLATVVNQSPLRFGNIYTIHPNPKMGTQRRGPLLSYSAKIHPK